MKRALVFFLLAAPAFAQNKLTDTALVPACGLDNSKFEVQTAKAQNTSMQADAGTALVVFIEDDSEFASHPAPTTRAGLDGSWIGATHGNSFLSFSVDPGEHHLCASWQTSVILGRGHKTAAAHFTAEAGAVYYFRVKNTWARDVGSPGITLSPLDSDEGQLLTNKYSLSTSHPKK
jgi:hypothetical protein